MCLVKPPAPPLLDWLSSKNASRTVSSLAILTPATILSLSITTSATRCSLLFAENVAYHTPHPNLRFRCRRTKETNDTRASRGQIPRLPCEAFLSHIIATSPSPVRVISTARSAVFLKAPQLAVPIPLRRALRPSRKLTRAPLVMARIQSPPILSQIRVARSYSEQTAALRALKDDIVGHVQRKERWIENGILESLVKNLQAVRSPVSRNGDESHSNAGQPRPLADSERVRLLSLELIASFSSGEWDALVL